ncbi:MAG: TolC family protein [Bacteroidales bacterium]
MNNKRGQSRVFAAMCFYMRQKCQHRENSLSLAFPILLFMGISLVLIPANLNAQRQVSLAECRQAALKRHELETQMELVESAAEAQQAMLRRLITPGAWGFAMASYQSDVPGMSATSDFGIDFSPMVRDQYRTGVYAKQRLYDGGEYRHRKALTETGRRIGAAEVERQQRILENGVDELFLTSILIGKGLEILQAGEEILLIRHQQLESLYREGEVYKVEVLEMEAALAEIRARQENLLADREKTRNMLATLTGIPIAEDDSLLLPRVKAAGKRTDDPLFDQLKLEMERVRQSKLLSRASVMPRIEAAGIAGYARPGLNLLSNEFDTYWIVGLSLKVPITGWRDHRRNIRTLTVEESQLSIRYDNLRRREELLISELDGEVVKYDRLMRRDEELIEKHTQIRKEYEAMLAEGVASATDLRQALSAESQSRLSKARHEMEKVRASLRREKALLEQPKY